MKDRSLDLRLPLRADLQRNTSIDLMLSCGAGRPSSDTLEAIAQALFKSWFVDFDPVRAKQQRLAAGMDEATAALFPDSFEESALGLVPRERSTHHSPVPRGLRGQRS